MLQKSIHCKYKSTEVKSLSRNTYASSRSTVKIPEVHSEPLQTSERVLFAKTVNGSQPWTIFAISSIWDIGQGSEYTSGFPAINTRHI